METVLRKSIPNAITMLIPVLLIQIIGKDATYTQEAVSAISTLAVTFSAYLNLVFICKPYTKWRVGVICISGGLLIATMLISVLLLGDMMHILPAFSAPGLFIYGMGLVALLSIVVHVGTKRVKLKDVRR